MKKVITFILLILITSCWLRSPEWSPSASPAQKRVAILGFKNLTGDAELDYLGSGFGETLTTKLSKVKELILIERMQIIKILEEQGFQLSGFVDEESAVKLGKILGVEYVIIGSFQKIGNKIKADTRLINVETGKIESADDIVGDYDDLFDLQYELAMKLTKSLDVEVKEDEKIVISKAPAKNLSAYEWYSKGVHYYEKFEYDSAITCFKKAVDIDEEYAGALNYLGLSYDIRGRWSEAIIVYEKAISLYLKEDDEKGLAITYNNIGLIYYNKGDYSQALNYYERSLKIEERIGNEPGMARTYNNIGIIYGLKGDYSQAMEYFERSLKIEERIGDERGMAMTYNNIGNIYNLKGDYSQALNYFEKSLKITERIGDEPGMAGTYNNIGLIYRKKGDIENVIYYLEKSVEIKCRIGHPDCEKDKKKLEELKK